MDLEVKIKEFSNQINQYQDPKKALNDFFNENIR